MVVIPLPSDARDAFDEAPFAIIHFARRGPATASDTKPRPRCVGGRATTTLCAIQPKKFTGIDDGKRLSQSAVMKIGVVNRVLGCGLLAIVIAGCGGSDDANKPSCGTADAPMAIELKDISPAAGATVPNSGIVETFTIVGRHLQITPTFALPPAHTAGQPVPAPTQWSIAVSGADTVYTSMPLSWEKAPGHVEADSYGLLETTSDHCISALPKKIFEYDVTAP
jgi:hypothetical protein